MELHFAFGHSFQWGLLWLTLQTTEIEAPRNAYKAEHQEMCSYLAFHHATCCKQVNGTSIFTTQVNTSSLQAFSHEFHANL